MFKRSNAKELITKAIDSFPKTRNYAVVYVRADQGKIMAGFLVDCVYIVEDSAPFGCIFISEARWKSYQ